MDALKRKEEDTASAPDLSSWATTDKTLFEQQAHEAKTAGQRAPEIFIKDGTSVRLRFRCKEPLVSFHRYRMKVNGKWRFFTQPPEGQDLFAEQGLRPQRVFLYEVIDIEGYTNKAGKRLRRIPRFFLATVRQYDQLRMLAENVGMPLTQFVVKMTRSGAGTDTVYSFFNEPPSPITDKEKETPRIKADITKYYTPLTVKEQRKILSGRTVGDADDE